MAYDYKVETEVWDEGGEFLYLVNQVFNDNTEDGQVLAYGSTDTLEEALTEAGKAVREAFNVQ